MVSWTPFASSDNKCWWCILFGLDSRVKTNAKLKKIEKKKEAKFTSFKAKKSKINITWLDSESNGHKMNQMVTKFKNPFDSNWDQNPNQVLSKN